MTSNVAGSEFGGPRSRAMHGEHDLMRYVVVLGRVLFSAIFVMAALSHFSQQTIGYAASQGVPMPSLLVPLAGIIATVGGLSIVLGYHARIGAWLIVLFLVPVTLIMHAFWAVPDPMMARMQQIEFMKNLSMLGGALLIAYFGPGPLSLDARRPRLTGTRSQHVSSLDR
ncbi:MAG TPA: DoxX family protein [Polyangiaceae bacterium]